MKTPSLTYSTFTGSGMVITRSVQTYVPGLYIVITETDEDTKEDYLSGNEVLEMMKNELKTLLIISFKSKALPSQVEGFLYFPAGYLVDDEPVLVAYNPDQNQAFMTTLRQYHTARD
jgi:hypothetical protein